MCSKCVCGGDVVIIKNPMEYDETIDPKVAVDLMIKFPYVAICKKCKEVFPLYMGLRSELVQFKKLGAEIVWSNIAMELYIMNETIKDPMKTIRQYKSIMYKEEMYNVL